MIDRKDFLIKPTNRVGIVCTTINSSREFFESYYRNISKYKNLDEVTLIVINDKKTPDDILELEEEFRQKGFDVRVLTINMQEEFLVNYPSLKAIIPYNSDNRRNIGYLFGVKRGSRIIISVDDDNFPIDSQDFVKNHSVCGTKKELKTIKSNNKWYNILNDAKISNETIIYPRGYPHHRRHVNDFSWEKKECEIAVNVGLWSNHPDVDAVTRIDNPARVLGYPDLEKKALAIGTFSPINSQNTSMMSEAVPAYYFVPMGMTIEGMRIDRFGDIWQGFFLKKCSDALGYTVSFGEPVCDHVRNVHNLFKDLREELNAIECTQYLSDFIEITNITGKNYVECYRDLANKLNKYFSENHTQYKELFVHISNCMLIWVSCFE